MKKINFNNQSLFSTGHLHKTKHVNSIPRFTFWPRSLLQIHNLNSTSRLQALDFDISNCLLRSLTFPLKSIFFFFSVCPSCIVITTIFLLIKVISVNKIRSPGYLALVISGLQHSQPSHNLLLSYLVHHASGFLILGNFCSRTILHSSSSVSSI